MASPGVTSTCPVQEKQPHDDRDIVGFGEDGQRVHALSLKRAALNLVRRITHHNRTRPSGVPSRRGSTDARTIHRVATSRKATNGWFYLGRLAIHSVGHSNDEARRPRVRAKCGARRASPGLDDSGVAQELVSCSISLARDTWARRAGAGLLPASRAAAGLPPDGPPIPGAR